MSEEAYPLLQTGPDRIVVMPLNKIIPRYGKLGHGDKEMQEKNHNGFISHGDKIIIRPLIFNSIRYFNGYFFPNL